MKFQFPGGSQLQSLRSSPSQGASRMGMGAGQSFRPLNHFGPCNEPVTVIWVAPQDVKSYDWTYFRSHFASRNHKSLEVWKRKSKKPAVCFLFLNPKDISQMFPEFSLLPAFGTSPNCVSQIEICEFFFPFVDMVPQMVPSSDFQITGTALRKALIFFGHLGLLVMQPHVEDSQKPQLRAVDQLINR